MKTNLFRLFAMSSMILMSYISFGQGPGAFNFHNNVECDVYVTVYAYEGSCGGIDCGSNVGSIGPVLVEANSSVNIASGYSGSGDIWGKVYVTYFSSWSQDGTSTCSSDGPGVCSGIDVHWDSCSSASLP